MPARRSIRNRRGRKRIDRGGFDLQLTSMMDVLIIILVFLLKSYATSTNSFSSVKGIQLPYSMSEDNPPDSLQVIITPDGLTFEDARIVDFLKTEASLDAKDPTYAFRPVDLDEGGRRILPLFDALIKARDKAELLRAKSKARDESGQPLPFEGVLAIQADKRVNYDTIRKIMYTAATADYKVFRFLAMKREI